jgi:hypothetical protein
MTIQGMNFSDDKHARSTRKCWQYRMANLRAHVKSDKPQAGDYIDQYANGSQVRQ